MAKVSVVIPCYNQGEYIDEAVDSVLSQTCGDFEIIIVNDGSTDENTLNILKDYSKPKTKVLHTINQGLPQARNNGIKEASGEYILPLDADDKIGHEYMEKAVKILDKDSEIGIVYSRAEVFGSEQSEWNLPDYSPERILLENMIFASGFFRKKDWERVGGYRSVMKYGCEDWDFWLSLIEIKKKVYRIPEVLFYYRVRKDSMVRLIAKETIPVIYEQLIENHRTLYTDNVKAIFGSYRDMREEVFRLSEKCMAGKNTVEEKNIIIENQKNLIAQLLEKEKALESIYNSYGWRIYCASISTLPVSYILNLIKKVRAHHILLKCDRVELFYDSIEISGWALTGIERVEIYLDNMLLDKAVYGLPRPDVEKVYPFLKDSGTAGFYFSSKLPILCPLGNNHIIKIKGITYEGRKREIITSVISKGIVKPVISLTDIELYSGSLEISGWVVSDYGIDRVEIYLNNSLIACPDTNRTSSEGARLYPFVKNSDKSGFFLFALLYKEKAVEYNVLVKAIGLNGERTEMKHTVTVKDSQLLLTNGKTDCYTEPVRAKSDIKETLEIPVSNGFDVLSKSKELREDIQKLTIELQKKDIIIQEQKEYIQEYRDYLNQVEENIKKASFTKGWKLMCLVRRVNEELLKGSFIQKKNFFRWIKNKLLKRPLPEELELLQFSPLHFKTLKIYETESEDFSVTIKRDYDLFRFPLIDWDYRWQRPQHMSLQFVRYGYRVFYFSITTVVIDKDNATYEEIGKEVKIKKLQRSLWEVKLCSKNNMNIYRDIITDPLDFKYLLWSIDYIKERFNILNTITIVDLPFWTDLVLKLDRNKIIYDCMDYHWGFAGNSSNMLSRETFLLEKADLIITSSQGLFNRVVNSNKILLRNGGEYEHFSQKPAELAPELQNIKRPVIGYYGAISEWFDIKLFHELARRNSDWTFILVGSTFGCDTSCLDNLRNVIFTGEKSYEILPSYLHGFDVCIIPFLVNELTMATNPVKIYEYLSAGKPVVSVRLPEVEIMSPMIRLASTAEEFEEAIRNFLKEVDDLDAISRRKAFALLNTWQMRFEKLEESINKFLL